MAGRIPRVFINDLLARTDIVDLIDARVKLKKQGKNYHACCPFHNEKTPSFKINRKLNVWYDHGIGKGGKLVDLGILLHHCTVQEFLEKLNIPTQSFSFHQQAALLQKTTQAAEKKIKLIAANPLTDPILCHYLETRNIPAEIGQNYCRQITYMNGQKQFYSIGFKNNSGGFEFSSFFSSSL